MSKQERWKKLRLNGIAGKARLFCVVLILSAAWLILASAISQKTPVGLESRDFFVSRGTAETGAINLVSAIYLGYRAFDTVGETIVLLLAIAGVVYMLSGSDRT